MLIKATAVDEAKQYLNENPAPCNAFVRDIGHLSVAFMIGGEDATETTNHVMCYIEKMKRRLAGLTYTTHDIDYTGLRELRHAA